jgi:hypothetical protein
MDELLPKTRSPWGIDFEICSFHELHPPWRLEDAFKAEFSLGPRPGLNPGLSPRSPSGKDVAALYLDAYAAGALAYGALAGR